MISMYVNIKGSVATIKVTGAMRSTQAFVVKDEITSALNVKGCTQVVVDSEDTTYIDSASINEFVRIERLVGGDNFSVKNPNEDIYEYLEINELQYWVK